ncbi:hypothetical protein CR513_21735, partial [Mucuna pruriens]
MTPIWNYLKHDTSFEDKGDTAKIRQMGSLYLIERVLHPLLKCLTKNEANYIMNKIHRGIYNFHSGRQTMVARVLRRSATSTFATTKSVRPTASSITPPLKSCSISQHHSPS